LTRGRLDKIAQANARALRAVKLRAAGLSFPAIAESMALSPEGARAALKRGRALKALEEKS
jgi:DNA-binding CsgD family transcriptional regulator